jgi:hypothetical protein
MYISSRVIDIAYSVHKKIDVHFYFSCNFRFDASGTTKMSIPKPYTAST